MIAHSKPHFMGVSLGETTSWKKIEKRKKYNILYFTSCLSDPEIIF